MFGIVIQHHHAYPGILLGAFILVQAQQYLRDRYGANDYYLVGYAAVFLVVMLFLPRGILPSLRDRVRRLRAPRSPQQRPKEVAAL